MFITHRPLSSSFYGLYLESYKVIPKRNYLGAYGYVSHIQGTLNAAGGVEPSPTNVRAGIARAATKFSVEPQLEIGRWHGWLEGFGCKHLGLSCVSVEAEG